MTGQVHAPVRAAVQAGVRSEVRLVRVASSDSLPGDPGDMHTIVDGSAAPEPIHGAASEVSTLQRRRSPGAA